MFKVKICGMRDPENIKEISNLNPDMMGFIFYEKSLRYSQNSLKFVLDSQIKKTGVFVNEAFDNIMKKVNELHLDYVQLHGEESPEFCHRIMDEGLGVIKAFSINETFDWAVVNSYEAVCSYFLFDAFGKQRGGNGVSFNWEILNNYYGRLPFLLSGGIGEHNIDSVLQIKHSCLAGIDINSRVEVAPGVKNAASVKKIIDKVRNMI